MTKRAIFFAALQLFVFSTLQAQSISEQLGGVKTHFLLYSLTTQLNATEQILILRAETKHNVSDTYGTGWGIGYRSYHLEFITREELKAQKLPLKIGKSRSPRLKLTFYGSNKNILASFMIPFDRVDRQFNPSVEGGPLFYSIDLINIPIVLLNKAVAIDLVKMGGHID